MLRKVLPGVAAGERRRPKSRDGLWRLQCPDRRAINGEVACQWARPRRSSDPSGRLEQRQPDPIELGALCDQDLAEG